MPQAGDGRADDRPQTAYRVKQMVIGNSVQALADTQAASPGATDVRPVFDSVLLQYLRPGSIGLATLYLFFAIAHWNVLAEPARSLMTALAIGSSLLFGAIAVVVRRGGFPAGWSHPMGAGCAGIVLANVLTHSFITNSPRETTNLILLIIGCGIVLLSTRWLAAVLCCAFVGWGLVTWSLVGPEFGHHLDYGVISAMVLALIVHAGRVRGLGRLHELRVRDQARAAELQEALESAERELTERRRIEAALQKAHEELDQRVRERTAELAKANEDLRAEITERQNAEAQLRHAQKMDAIGQLAAGIAHDFNNMLTVIHGHAMRLAESRPEPSELLNEIIEAADRAGALTQQLLVFSRKQTMQRRPIDLNGITRNMARMLSRVVGDNIEVELQLCPMPAGIEGDPLMIEQVLLNLAINARDAMPNGGRLVIHTRKGRMETEDPQALGAKSAESYVRLAVSDTGTGIVPSVMPRIFEPFFTTKPIGKGTGLGLSTVYAIVQQHDGWINVVSKVNRGTTFNIGFPEVPISSGSSENTNVAGVRLSGSECILVVEDEPMLRQLACRYLRDFGYRVLEAESGIAALDVWQKHGHEIQLLLTDLVMPGGVSGRELAQRCISSKPELKVVYTSGYSTDFDELEPSLRRGHQFLPKPYRVHTLTKLIRESLDSR